jgi:hypothetical protein
MINESSRPILLTRVVGSGWIGDRESLIREVYQTSHRYAFQTNSERAFGSLAAVRMYVPIGQSHVKYCRVSASSFPADISKVQALS